MLGQRPLGHPPRFSPLTSDRGPWPLGWCSVETASLSTSTHNRNQLRPSPRGNALAGLSFGGRPGMSVHTPRDLFLHGPEPLEARRIWAQLPKGRGWAGLSHWPLGPLSRSSPLPLEDLHGCFESTLAGYSRKPRTVLLSPGEKRFGWSSNRALGPEPGDQLGVPHAQAKSEAHAKVCSCSLYIQRARLCERVSGSSLAAPVAPSGWNGAEPT